MNKKITRRVNNFKGWTKELTRANFEAQIKDCESGCIEWTGCIKPTGYGVISVNCKTRRVHRVAYWLSFGKWPKNYLLHTCDNRRCVNVEHLKEGTQLENMKQAKERGRIARGDRVPSHKLTRSQVIAIRSLLEAGASLRRCARIYQVSKTTIHNIKIGRSWSWAKN